MYRGSLYRGSTVLRFCVIDYERIYLKCIGSELILVFCKDIYAYMEVQLYNTTNTQLQPYTLTELLYKITL